MTTSSATAFGDRLCGRAGQRDGIYLQARGYLGGTGRCGAEGLVALLADQIGDEVAVWPDQEVDHCGRLHGGHDPQRGAAERGLPGGSIRPPAVIPLNRP